MFEWQQESQHGHSGVSEWESGRRKGQRGSWGLIRQEMLGCARTSDFNLSEVGSHWRVLSRGVSGLIHVI